eukprot:2164944-Rhodomonas_salina.1
MCPVSFACRVAAARDTDRSAMSLAGSRCVRAIRPPVCRGRGFEGAGIAGMCLRASYAMSGTDLELHTRPAPCPVLTHKAKGTATESYELPSTDVESRCGVPTRALCHARY